MGPVISILVYLVAAAVVLLVVSRLNLGLEVAGFVPAIVAAAIAAACVLVPAAGADQQRGNERVAIFYYPWYSTPAKDGDWEE